MTFVKYIGTMEPAEVCMMAGTCLDQALARVGPVAPLKARAVVAANQLVTLMQAPTGNDHCETCKVTSVEGFDCRLCRMHNTGFAPSLKVDRSAACSICIWWCHCSHVWVVRYVWQPFVCGRFWSMSSNCVRIARYIVHCSPWFCAPPRLWPSSQQQDSMCLHK